MNVIFHRNCLDGVFSSYIAYLTTKLTNEDELNNFIKEIKEAIEMGDNNLTDCTLKEDSHKSNNNNQVVQINQEFFHTPRGVYFNAYSFYAGEYYPLKFPGNSRLLLILDTNLKSSQNIQEICKSHELVIMIDHHTSFMQIQKNLPKLLLKNFGYVFDEQHSAAKLTFNFFQKFLNLNSKLTPLYSQVLLQQLDYVSANDTKYKESRQSKSFVLGFYYFEIELSHGNPNLYKRLGLLDLPYLLERGKNLYANHLSEIKSQIQYAKVMEFVFNNQRFKSKKCLHVQPHNANKISDIGNVLAFVSAKNEMENLCVLAMKRDSEIRVSCRSHKLCKEASALEFARIFEGGGHKEAAGFKMSCNKFKSCFKVHALSKFGININLEVDQIQKILLGNS